LIPYGLGYVNPDTKQATVSKGGSCVNLPLVFNVSDVDVEPTRFKVSMTTSDIYNSSMEVYAVASRAGDLEVKINSQTKKNLEFKSLLPVIVQHENLSPGTQYRMMVFPPTGPITSQIVTTRCYCSIIGSDRTGVPTNAYSKQENGYVTFVFTDNSRYVYVLFSFRQQILSNVVVDFLVLLSCEQYADVKKPILLHDLRRIQQILIMLLYLHLTTTTCLLRNADPSSVLHYKQQMIYVDHN
jgi:hypothetical protein